MSGQPFSPGDADTLARRCRETVSRLGGLYGWRRDPPHDGLAAAVQQALAEEPAPADRLIEQSCCRLHFAALHAELASGEDPEGALAELFRVTWFEGEDGTAVRYGGYLFRSALTVIRRRLAASFVAGADLEQLAADAAGRALTTVHGRFRDCRDADSFWGWTARVAERAAIDELRSGRATGGSSVHAAPLDDVTEGQLVRGGGVSVEEERQVDAISVRQELLRKCRLGKLSVDQREALVRSFWGGEKPAEIAAALAAERGSTVTAAQVSLWKHRGLQVMEANLRDRGYA